MINYSEEFKSQCKDVYPNWNELHEALEHGSEFAGRYLNDASFDTINIDDVLSIEDMTSLKQLKEKALKIKKKKELYNKWCEIFNQNIKED
ncbi:MULTISPECIES: hypothetical protein [Clostridium]|uniref:hypothetical protein n=1 Tax=Clostridium TaxID=1485 RepID=UPI00069E14BD|nr:MULTISPECIES: hypothetical protein [Clostridium]KOF57846.1 hypothetical protein AGR56_16720 [Clostridium sp. DMHC 10]MCD2345075.1 hypothetical protein [Clostridium guangxiense]